VPVLFFIFLFQHLYPETRQWTDFLAFCLFLSATLTDLADGYYARELMVPGLRCVAASSESSFRQVTG
jgi:phosphatidylglycerophosphate synthase